MPPRLQYLMQPLPMELPQRMPEFERPVPRSIDGSVTQPGEVYIQSPLALRFPETPVIETPARWPGSEPEQPDGERYLRLNEAHLADLGRLGVSFIFEMRDRETQILTNRALGISDVEFRPPFTEEPNGQLSMVKTTGYRNEEETLSLQTAAESTISEALANTQDVEDMIEAMEVVFGSKQVTPGEQEMMTDLVEETATIIGEAYIEELLASRIKMAYRSLDDGRAYEQATETILESMRALFQTTIHQPGLFVETLPASDMEAANG